MSKETEEAGEEGVKNALQRAGWVETTVKDFLGLSDEEEAEVERRVEEERTLASMRQALSGALRRRRETVALSQTALAAKIGSSQSRVAKAEAGKPDVSFDLLVKGLLATGATAAEVGAVFASAASGEKSALNGRH